MHCKFLKSGCDFLSFFSIILMWCIFLIAVVLDTNKWFHQTDIMGKEMSITIGSEYD